MAPYQRQDFYSFDNIALYHALGARHLKYQKNSSSVYIDFQEKHKLWNIIDADKAINCSFQMKHRWRSVKFGIAIVTK